MEFDENKDNFASSLFNGGQSRDIKVEKTADLLGGLRKKV